MRDRRRSEGTRLSGNTEECGALVEENSDNMLEDPC